MLVRFGERNVLGDAINTKIPGIRGGQADRGKGILKKVLEEKELDLMVCRIFICLTRVLCRGMARVSPLKNEEYICLTYVKSSSWSMGKGRFKSRTEIFKVTG